MPNFHKLILLLLISSVLLFACGTYPCKKASSSFSLIGYTDAESDPIILRRFSKGSGFATLHDTLIINKGNSHFQRQTDTVHILHSIDSDHDITSTYDYEVFLPNASRTYRLTEVVEDIQQGKNRGTKEHCLNPITSYKLNGQLLYNPNFPFIYLRK